jgi:hypothetical protein
MMFGDRVMPATGAMSSTKLNVSDDFGPDVIAGAGTVLDDQLLAEPFAERVGDQSRQNVRRASRGVPDNPADRSRGIGLSAGNCRESNERACGNHGSSRQRSAHFSSAREFSLPGM